MRRLICLLITVFLLLPWMMPVLSAAEEEPTSVTPLYEALKNNSVTYSCVYNGENRTVTVSGTVSHDTMIRCANYRIAVYRVLPGETLSSVLSAEENEPLVSTDISVKFSFTLPAQTAVERFSGYAVVLIDPEGTMYSSGDEIYTQIPTSSENTQGTPASYKGISHADVSLSANVGAGSAIIPVYIDRLFSKSSAGYLYHMDQGYLYFDKDYVDRLDAMVRSYSVTGCDVYLQLLLPTSGTELAMSPSSDPDTLYYMPNVYSHDLLPKLSAISTFLVSRYDEERTGRIEGMILGSRIDQREYNEYGDMDYSKDYARAYALYLLVMGASAREVQGDISLVIPFGDRNDYLTSTKETSSPSVLLESILRNLSQMGFSHLSLMTMIESEQTPYGIDEDFLTQKDGWAGKIDRSRLGVDSLTDYERYLESISAQFSNAPSEYLYRWIPDESLGGISLACAYAYGYYASMRDTGPLSFIYSPKSQEQVLELRQILRYIDTAESLTVTASLLEYFGTDRWGTLLQGIENKDLAFREHIACDSILESSNHFKGSFSFLDFSTGNISEWFAGTSCGEVRSGFGEEGKRGVYAQMAESTEHQYGELICHFEYPESMIYTPYLEFVLEMTDSAPNNESLYEVTVTVGAGEGSASASRILRAGETASFVLNLQKYHEAHLIEYLKFSVRKIRGDANSFSFWVFEMNGLSTAHSSEELSELIAVERAKIRNQLQGSDKTEENKAIVWIALGVLIVITAVGLLITGRMKQTERDGRNQDASANIKS